jgi:flagellar hook-associated protein 3 FlgL
MRVTQGLEQSQFLAAIETLESNLSQTQNQISSNRSFTTASQNPTAAGAANNYNQALAQSQQYGTNASSAQTNLNTEDNALSQVQNQLQSLRDLALEASNGDLTNTDRTAIAAQAVQIQNSLLALANTQNGNGEYIFSGFAAQTQPFTASATGATYNGDQGQRQVQIAAGQSVADGDNGATVFNQIKTGNGTFAVAAGAGNTGSGLIGASTVSNPAAFAGGPFTIKFTTPTAYTVTNAAAATVASGTYADGQTIAFSGVQVTLSGTPAVNDTFGVAASTNQSLFTTVQNLVTALQTGDLRSDQQHRSGARSDLGCARHRRRPPQCHHHSAVGRRQPAGPAQDHHLIAGGPGLCECHHDARSAEHDLERGAAGLHPYPRLVAVQIYSVMMAAGAVHVPVFQLLGRRLAHADDIHGKM